MYVLIRQTFDYKKEDLEKQDYLGVIGVYNKHSQASEALCKATIFCVGDYVKKFMSGDKERFGITEGYLRSLIFVNNVRSQYIGAVEEVTVEYPFETLDCFSIMKEEGMR